MAPLRGPKLWEGSGRCFRCRVGFRGFIFLLCVEGEWVVSAEWSCCYNEIVDEIVIVHTRHLNLSISPLPSSLQDTPLPAAEVLIGLKGTILPPFSPLLLSLSLSFSTDSVRQRNNNNVLASSPRKRKHFTRSSVMNENVKFLKQEILSIHIHSVYIYVCVCVCIFCMSMYCMQMCVYVCIYVCMCNVCIYVYKCYYYLLYYYLIYYRMFQRFMRRSSFHGRVIPVTLMMYVCVYVCVCV